MRRLAKLSVASLSVAALLVIALAGLGLAASVSPLTAGHLVARADDPAPDPSPAKPATVGDLVSSLATAKAAQSDAQTARDALAKSLADADATLAGKSVAVLRSDAVLKSAVTRLGPVIIDGVVYEPSGDGGYRSFRPAPADTPVPDDPAPSVH